MPGHLSFSRQERKQSGRGIPRLKVSWWLVVVCYAIFVLLVQPSSICFGAPGSLQQKHSRYFAVDSSTQHNWQLADQLVVWYFMVYDGGGGGM